jgi:hypothetical protein
MAVNIYLALFRRYDHTLLERMERKYFLFCYLFPLIPAFIFVFIESEAKGKVYGSATVSP